MGKRQRGPDGEPIPANPRPENACDVTVDGQEYTAITEGRATVLFPKVAHRRDRDGGEYEVQGDVFYNPVQQFNRDLSVLAIRTFGRMFCEEKSSRKTRRTSRAGKANTEGTTTPVKKLSEQPGVEAKNACNTTPTDVDADTSLDTMSGPSASSNPGYKSSSAPDGKSAPQQTVHFRVLDALSATGLRALRYAQEIPFLTSATANDLDRSAVDSITKNIEYNKAKWLTENPTASPGGNPLAKIKVSLANAQHHMYSVLSPPPSRLEGAANNCQPHVGKYEVIDLDPYGTAAPFLDAAVQAVADGGLLCVTCTDSGVWASVGYSEKCFSLYGGLPVKGEWSHEAGLRLILHSIATTAGKYGYSIEPLLSLSIDFYARVFVRIRRSPAEVKKLASTTMIVYNCDEGCGSWVQQPLGKSRETQSKRGTGTFLKFGLARAPTAGENCAECGFPMHLAGPMWRGPLHSEDFVSKLLSSLPASADPIYPTTPRITGMLQTALQEAAFPDHPFFFVPTQLSRTIHCEAPPQAAVRGALLRLGYRVARSHCKPCSIKTDAPSSILWEIMKRWIEKKPIKEGSLAAGMAGFNIMQKGKDNTLDIVLDEALGKEEKLSGVVRYQMNPTANWGPMGRAKGAHANGQRVNETRPEKKLR